MAHAAQAAHRVSCGDVSRHEPRGSREKIFLADVDRQDFTKTLAEACQKTNWNDLIKLEIAARLRWETTLSTKAIAARMHLGSTKTANRSLHRYMRGSGAMSPGQGQPGL